MTQKPSIFISYGRGDDDADYENPNKSFLRRLYNDLIADGYRVWWDREHMPARGATFLQEIQDAVTVHDKLVLIVGEYAMDSKYVLAEIEQAQRLCKPIIPLLINGDYSLIPSSLANYHAPDFRETRDYGKAINELKRVLEEPQPDPASLYNVPRLPRGYIERDEFPNVRDGVLSDAINPTVTQEEDQIVYIQGPGGIGKSTIASAIGRVCEVRRRYPDNIIFITLGKTPIIAQKQGDIGVIFGDLRDNYQDPDTGKTNLKRILANKQILLVLDDVWSHKDIEAFMVLNPRSRMIVTTRDYSLALKVEGHEFDITKLTVTEGLNLLSAWQKRTPDANNPHEEQERQIIDILDGYTLALALVGAKLAQKRSGYTHVEMIERLQQERTFSDLKIDEDDKNFNLEKSLYLSYVDLSEIDQRRFRELGVVAPNVSFDLSLIASLWQDTDYDAQDALNRMMGNALVNKLDDGKWQQHVVLRAYADALLRNANEEHDVFTRYVEHVSATVEFDTLQMQTWNERYEHLYPHIDYLGNTLTVRYTANNNRYNDLLNKLIYQVRPYISNRPIVSDGNYRGLEWLLTANKYYAYSNQKRSQSLILSEVGIIYIKLGRKEDALETYQKVLSLQREVCDIEGEATTLTNIGAVYSVQ